MPALVNSLISPTTGISTVSIIIDTGLDSSQYLSRLADGDLRLREQDRDLQQGQIVFVRSSEYHPEETRVQLPRDNVRLQGITAWSLAGRDANRFLLFACCLLSLERFYLR
jgi:hypothetical protein